MTGTYKIDTIIDQNTSGAQGGRGTFFSEDTDQIVFNVKIRDQTTGGSVYSEATGGVGAFYWTDFATSGLVTLVSTKNYKVEITMINYTESIPSATASVTLGYNIYTI